MNLFETSSLTQRLISSCSTPQSSGNSERIAVPPSAMRRSAAWPIAGFAERPENPSEPPRLETKIELRQRRRLAGGFVSLGKSQKCLTDGLRNHRRLGRALLLLEDQKRLAETWIAALHLLKENGNLCVLATEAEDGCAGYIGVVNIASKQGTQISGVLVSATAAAFVGKEFNAVEVAKEPGRGRSSRNFRERKSFYLFGVAFAVQPGEFGNLPTIDLRRGESQFFLERLLQNVEISVLAKNQGKNEPIVPGTDLTIGPPVS